MPGFFEGPYLIELKFHPEKQLVVCFELLSFYVFVGLGLEFFCSTQNRGNICVPQRLLSKKLGL
jgi:hypothetical protein